MCIRDRSLGETGVTLSTMSGLVPEVRVLSLIHIYNGRRGVAARIERYEFLPASA